MHRIRLAILLFLCVSAAGCQPVPGVLLDAEAIVMEHPDSAARLLEGVPAPEKRLSRRNYAHYALVLTQARWLAGENMIDDTLSDVALDYYRTHTDDFAAAHKAYYYAAKIAHQRRQPEVAMTLLLKSRDMLPPKGEWRRHYVVETWLGVFCGQQHLFEEKIRHAQQAYAYADSMERYDWMCISLGDMAHAYMGLDNYDSMEYYAIKALRLAEEKGITENTSPKWAMLIESALKRKEYRKAEEYWEKGFGHAPAWTRYSWLSTKADICNRTGRYDTALELTDSSRRMCADTTHLTSRALWALNTSNAWEGKGDAARSLEALKQYIRLKDSIDEKVHSAEVLNIRKLWRYEQLKTQNAALQSQKQHRERIVYETILICAALMLLGAWLGLRMWHRAKLREFAQQKRILRQENELDAMRRKEEHLRTTFFRQLNSRFIAQVRQGGESRKCRMSDEDWKTIFTHADAVFDKEYRFDAADIAPMITYGTNPGMGMAVDAAIPADADDKALKYMGFESGETLQGKPVDYVFVGSCTNGRIEDLRLFARLVEGRRKADNITAWIVPGSKGVEAAARAEGLDRILADAGFELRQPGCSACLAMNADKIPAGKYSVSTSNRNFEGRQGPGARTMLSGIAAAAAAAVCGRIEDPRKVFEM